MAADSHTLRIRRELLLRICRAVLQGDLPERADRIPLEMAPRDRPGGGLRCCVHHERAVLRARVLAAMGFAAQDPDDELRPLGERAGEALVRTRRGPQLLTVIADACSACVPSSRYVSDACRGCTARACALNCPKQAIRMERGRAVIDPGRCIDCGKCEAQCPFHAILRLPVPCQEACPVDALVRTDDGRQEIRPEACIACGRCLRACPFGAIAEVSELVPVLAALAAGRPMVALAAPALAAQFQSSPEHLVGALRRLGFRHVVEVAAGADRVLGKEARELAERLEAGQPFMTSSCCPAYTGLVAGRLPKLQPRLSSAPTPLAVAARLARERFGDLPRVFLGPCLAKRREALDGRVEHVLTFEETGAALVAMGIDVDACEPSAPDLGAGAAGRRFAAAGGVAAGVAAATGAATESLAGLGPETLRRLRLYAAGKGPARFLEVMGCEGGCLGGPCALADPRVARVRVPA
jgi:[FeFe] hydrogenase (group B1/B3)